MAEPMTPVSMTPVSDELCRAFERGEQHPDAEVEVKESVERIEPAGEQWAAPDRRTA